MQKFIRIDQFNIARPEFSFTLKAEDEKPWEPFTLRFDIGGLCGGRELRTWSDTLTATPEKTAYAHTFAELAQGFQLQGCRAEVLKVSRPDMDPAPSITEADIKAEIAKEEAAHIADLEAETEAQDRLDQENERQRKLRDAQTTKELAKQRTAEATERAKLADQARRSALACHALYLITADKKISDLTVREDGLVKTCRDVGMYH